MAQKSYQLGEFIMTEVHKMEMIKNVSQIINKNKTFTQSLITMQPVRR